MTRTNAAALVVWLGGCTVGPGIIGESATQDATGSEDDGASSLGTDSMSGRASADGTDGACTDSCAPTVSWLLEDHTGALELEWNPAGAVDVLRFVVAGDVAGATIERLDPQGGGMLESHPLATEFDVRDFVVGNAGQSAFLLATDDGYELEVRRSSDLELLWQASNGGPSDTLMGQDVAELVGGGFAVARLNIQDDVPPISNDDFGIDAYAVDGTPTWHWGGEAGEWYPDLALLPAPSGTALLWVSSDTYRAIGFDADGATISEQPTALPQFSLSPPVARPGGWAAVARGGDSPRLVLFDEAFVEVSHGELGPIPEDFDLGFGDASVIATGDALLVLLSSSEGGGAASVMARRYDGDANLHGETTVRTSDASQAIIDLALGADGEVYVLGFDVTDELSESWIARIDP